MSRKGRETARRGLGAALAGAVALSTGGALANGADMAETPPLIVASPEAHETNATTKPVGIEGGARAFHCDALGFVSVVHGLNEQLRSPQFPGATVQAADGLIVLTAPLELQGITAAQTSYITRDAEDRWTFAGFRGTAPFADRCADITADLAASFTEIALATSWGMPAVERRIALFDALEDDLRTRLELAEVERDALLTETEAIRQQVAGLTTELVTARMAVCEIARQTQGLLTQASFGPEAAPPAAFGDLLAEAATMSECLDGATMTVGTLQEP